MIIADKTITPPDWMTAPESGAVFAALQDAGAEPQVLFVGGCVRNALLGVAVKDADLATIHHPDETSRRLMAAGIKVVPTGIEHGTVTAVVNGKPFEITTLRRDVETDGRHAVVAFTNNWVEDAKRRDFTINTLLADLEGNIYDPLRIGINDLEVRKVIFVGDPAERIAEDYLRVLRFFRFHGLYGQGAPDEAALVSCRNAGDKIVTLSRERITQEFLQILASANIADTLALMIENKIMADVVHPNFEGDAFSALIGLQNRSGLVSITARIAALCAGDAGHMAVLDQYLLLSKAQAKNLALLLGAINAPMGIKERLYRFGRDVGAQSVLLLATGNFAKLDDDDLAVLKDWEIPLYPLTGKDLSGLGMEQGPGMGQILEAVETWWIEWDFQPGHEDCLDRARALIGELA